MPQSMQKCGNQKSRMTSWFNFLIPTSKSRHLKSQPILTTFSHDLNGTSVIVLNLLWFGKFFISVYTIYDKCVYSRTHLVGQTTSFSQFQNEHWSVWPVGGFKTEGKTQSSFRGNGVPVSRLRCFVWWVISPELESANFNTFFTIINCIAFHIGRLTNFDSTFASS